MSEGQEVPIFFFCSGQADVSVNEGAGTATFTVTASGQSASDITVNYATSDGTAVAPGDYTAASGTLTIASGSTTATFTVTIIDDVLDELTYFFLLDKIQVVFNTVPCDVE